MKKIILALALCAALLLNGALAEDSAPYYPGQLTRSLFSEAFDAGKIITADLSVAMDIDADVMELDEETAALSPAVIKLLSDMHLRVGLGKLEDGLRLTLGATLDAPEGALPVSVNAAANLTLDGVSVESDLVPTQRVTAKWETLLALAGADERLIGAVSQLRNLDQDAWAAWAQSQILSFSDGPRALGAALEPYGQIIVSYLATLPSKVEENVPAQDDFPAVPTRVTLSMTARRLAELSTLLVDYLEEDKMLLPALASMRRTTPDALLADLRSGIESLGEQRFTVTAAMGTSMASFPFYITVSVTPDGQDQPDKGMELILVPNEEGTFCHIALNFYALNDEGEKNDAFSLSMDVKLNMDDPVLFAGSEIPLHLEILSGAREKFVVDMTGIVSGTTTEEGLPAAQQAITEEARTYWNDQPTTRVALKLDTLRALTADGGEMASINGALESYYQDWLITSTGFGLDGHVVSDGNGGLEGYHTVSFQMADVGINDFSLKLQYTCEDYDPATTQALEEIALETVSQNDFTALQNRVYNAGMMKLVMTLPLLPPELVDFTGI